MRNDVFRIVLASKSEDSMEAVRKVTPSVINHPSTHIALTHTKWCWSEMNWCTFSLSHFGAQPQWVYDLLQYSSNHKRMCDLELSCVHCIPVSILLCAIFRGASFRQRSCANEFLVTLLNWWENQSNVVVLFTQLVHVRVSVSVCQGLYS